MAPAPVDGAEAGDVKPPPGVILPPKEIRALLEKTAEFIARRGDAFEGRVRDTAKTNPKLQFILEDSPYNPFYLWRISEIKEGRGLDINDNGTPVPAKAEKRGPAPPPEFQFSARMPTINAVDLEIVKLTALFTAKNGRSWMTTLSQREARNYQFDFLRPQHSFYQYFDRLVTQYRDLLTGDSEQEGRPQKKRMTELEHNVQDKFHVLEKARVRAEWVKHQETQKARKEEEAEKEKLEYAQVDWHDFVVVGTIEFTEADDQVDLPPPTSLNDLQSASLEQKSRMNLAPQGMRLEEAMPDQDNFYNYQQQTPQPVQMPPPQTPYNPSPQPPPSSASPWAPPQYAQDVDDDARIAERTIERERAQQAQAAVRGTGPMKIVNNYIPRAQARRQAANTVQCPVCKQQVAPNEYEEHVRIEMLDPRWREQSRIAQQRSSTTNLSTADVANNLKRLASQRSDVFDPVTGQAISEEEAQRRKRVELGSYDGVSQTPAAGAPPGVVQTLPGAQQGLDGGAPLDVQEQIRALHQKYAQP